MFTNIQYLATVLTYTRGDEFREAVYKNVPFILNAAVMFVLSYYIIAYGADNGLNSWLQVVNISNSVRITIIVGSIINVVITFCYELALRKIVNKCSQRNSSQ